jgi:IclR family transcriptional regulator, pca regulon regulatory protein
MTDLDTAGRGRDFVLSLERGLAVLKAFDREHSRLTLADVARRTGMTRAAARRFLLTLVELGYMDLDGREFFLRPRVLELGHAYLSSLSLNDVAAPHMERLVAQVHESSSVAVLDGDDIVYVVRVPTARIMTVSIAVGTRFPAHATSLGRVLLAGLSATELDGYLHRAVLHPLTRRTVTDPFALRRAVAAVAAQGYSVVDQELEDGLRSVAVPIVDVRQGIVASLNVSTHASRTTLDGLRRDMLPALQVTARAISDDLASVHSGAVSSSVGASGRR